MYSAFEHDTLNIHLIFFISRNEILTCALLLLSFTVLVDTFLLRAVCKILSPLFKWGENWFILCALISWFNSQRDSKVRSTEVIQTQYIHWQNDLELQSHVQRWKETNGYLTCKNCSREGQEKETSVLGLYCAVGTVIGPLPGALLIPNLQVSKLSHKGWGAFTKNHFPEIHSWSQF